ncbi:MAG: MFS transporter [Novosphingobium sp.]|nr:MFS transporter [Novosphingobium sp.]
MTGNFAIGWRQVACCFLLLAADSFIASGYSVVAVPLGHEFHPSRMVLMLAMTVLSGGSALLAPPFGALMDRISVRLMMVLGSLLLAAGYVALSFATSFAQVLVIFGVFIAPANVLIGPIAATVLLSRWFVGRRGTALGLAIAGVAMGSVIYPPLVQWLLDQHAWREAFRLVGLVLLIGTLPAAALVIDSPADRGRHPDGVAADPIAADRARAGVTVSAREILTDPAFWLAFAIFATVTSGMKGMITNLAPVALDQGIKARDAAFLISIYGGCGFVAKMGFAAVADRLSPRTLMFVSLTGFACGMACLTQAAAGYRAIALGVGLIGLFGGMMVPMQSLLVPRIFGQRVVGRAMGLLSMVTLCALLSTPPLFGLIFDLTGSYTAIFVTFAALAAGVMLAVPYIRLHPRAESPQPSVQPAAG